MTGVQTCALPISPADVPAGDLPPEDALDPDVPDAADPGTADPASGDDPGPDVPADVTQVPASACINCHTDYPTLKVLLPEDPGGEVEGGGG